MPSFERNRLLRFFFQKNGIIVCTANLLFCAQKQPSLNGGRGGPFLKSIIPKLQSRLHLKLFASKPSPKPHPNELLTKEKSLPLLPAKKTVKPPNLLQKKSLVKFAKQRISRPLSISSETKAARFKAA